MKPYTLKMLTEDEIDNMTVLEIQNELHTLNKIRHKNFPKEDEDNLADFHLLSQKVKKAFEMIDYIFNSITQDFVDHQRKMLHVWYSLSAIYKDLKSLGYKGYDK